MGVPEVSVSTEKTRMGNDLPTPRHPGCMNPYSERPEKDEGEKWAVANGMSWTPKWEDMCLKMEGNAGLPSGFEASPAMHSQTLSCVRQGHLRLSEVLGPRLPCIKDPFLLFSEGQSLTEN